MPSILDVPYEDYAVDTTLIYPTREQRLKWGLLDRDEDGIVSSYDILLFVKQKFPEESIYTLNRGINHYLSALFATKVRDEPLDLDISKMNMAKGSNAANRAEYYCNPFDVENLLTDFIRKHFKNDKLEMTIDSPLSPYAYLSLGSEILDYAKLPSIERTYITLNDNFETQQAFEVRKVQEAKWAKEENAWRQRVEGIKGNYKKLSPEEIIQLEKTVLNSGWVARTEHEKALKQVISDEFQNRLSGGGY